MLLVLALAAEPPPRYAPQEERVDTVVPRGTVTLQPIGLLSATVELELERVLSPRVTYYLAPRLRFGSGAFGEDGASVFDVRGSIGARLFPFADFGAEAPEGLWAGPEIGLGWTRASRDGVQAQGIEVRMLGTAGYTLLVDNVFVLSGGGGLGAGRGVVDVDDVERDTTLSFVWALRLAVGFAF